MSSFDHETSIDQGLLRSLIVPVQQDDFPKGHLDLVLGHRLDCYEVDAEHQGLERPGGVLQVGACTHNLGLQRWNMTDLQERVDVIDVHLPQLEGLDGWWMWMGNVSREA